MPSHKYDDSKQHAKDKIAHRKIMDKKVIEASVSKRVTAKAQKEIEDKGFKRAIVHEYIPNAFSQIWKEEVVKSPPKPITIKEKPKVVVDKPLVIDDELVRLQAQIELLKAKKELEKEDPEIKIDEE